VTGTQNNACGAGGAACANCAATGSFCNGLVEPRRCNNQQSTCPAPVGECPGGTTTAVTPLLQGRCTDAELDAIGLACAAGAESAACAAAIAAATPTCGTCLAPFNHPFEEHTGLYACIAPSLTNACRRATGCATYCETTSCSSCSAATEDQCYVLVDGVSGQCRREAVSAATCANPWLAAGQPCSPSLYPGYGAWLRANGDRFCGNGP
jgi:hypothetical protein